MADKPKQIDVAITAIMREVGAIGKDRENEQQRYSYRGIEDVYNRLQPLMAKHGIYSVPKLLDLKRDTGQTKAGGNMFFVQLTVEYTFRADDGSSVVVVVPGEGMDPGDKASNKAMSAAHKYALCQLFQIPFQIVDAEVDSPDGKFGVSQGQRNQLVKDWVNAYGSDISKDDQPGMFLLWVMQTASIDEMEASDYRLWTPEELTACRENLESLTGQAFKDSGLTKPE